MKPISTRIFLLLCLLLGYGPAQAQENMRLENNRLKIEWINTPSGWAIHKLALKSGDAWQEIDHPSGEYTLLRSDTQPAEKSQDKFFTTTGKKFPGDSYKY